MTADHDADDDVLDHLRSASARTLLQMLASGDPDEVMQLRDAFTGLGRRAFGMLLFVATLPAFIPIPGAGGVVSGPLAILIGLQVLIGRRTPWLPAFIARRGPRRHAIARFETKLAPWLKRLERLVKPRMAGFLDYRLGSALSGLLLILLGVLLALPIPLTNYLFGALLLLFALALLERDGALMCVAWVVGGSAVLVVGLLSGNLVAMVVAWFDRLT